MIGIPPVNQMHSNTARLRFRSPQPPLKRGAKSLLKSPFLSGDLGGSILGILLNRAVLKYTGHQTPNKTGEFISWITLRNPDSSLNDYYKFTN